MEKSEALRIVQALADGIDPITGEVFPDNSPYQHPQIIRALFAAVRVLEQGGGGQRQEQILLGNAGKPWNVDEDRQLCEGFDAGMTISQLAHKHQRTNGSIRSRLEKKGKLELDAPNEQPR